MEFTDEEVSLLSQLIIRGFRAETDEYNGSKYTKLMHKLATIGLRQLLEKPIKERVTE